ncbi:hypothetical protein DIPPA_32503 [Diplonema papillatum]|nr:hypothetical protein DIPPA_32503 [Diplonema papillatum]
MRPAPLLFAACCSLLLQTAAGQGMSWSRPSGWVPHAVWRESALQWIGQDTKCVREYGNFLSSYREAYEAPACLSRTRVAAAAQENGVVPAAPLNVSYGELPYDERPGSAGCVRACFVAFTAEYSPVDDGGPTALPNLNGSLGTPLQNLQVVWENATETCWCFGFHDVGLLAEAPESECDPLTLLGLPLGCLWSEEEGCREADGDSCLWTKEECCLDSKGYPWRYLTTPPLWWMITGIMLLLVAILMVLCRQVHPRPPPDDGNVLRTELIEKHKMKYEAYLEKLACDVPLGDTISQCSICLLDLTEDRCGKFPCGHQLHLNCMKDYIMYQIGKAQKKYPECPLCRQRVMLDDDVDDDDEDSNQEHGPNHGDLITAPVATGNVPTPRPLRQSPALVDEDESEGRGLLRRRAKEPDDDDEGIEMVTVRDESAPRPRLSSSTSPLHGSDTGASSEPAQPAPAAASRASSPSTADRDAASPPPTSPVPAAAATSDEVAVTVDAIPEAS